MDVGDVTLVYTDGPAYYEVIKSIEETQTTIFGPKTIVSTVESYIYKLHIPTGSISAGIEIDMQD